MQRLGTRAGRSVEDVGRTVVVVRVVVDDDHKVRVAVVTIDGVEREEVPALRAVEVTGIDLDGCGRIESNNIGRTAEGAQCGGLEVDGADYLGSSDIGMPLGTALPEGQWSLDILYKDGSKVSRTFEVNYGDVEKALVHFAEADTDEAWYDSAENLTVLPGPVEKKSDDSSDLSE